MPESLDDLQPELLHEVGKASAIQTLSNRVETLNEAVVDMSERVSALDEHLRSDYEPKAVTNHLRRRSRRYAVAFLVIFLLNLGRTQYVQYDGCKKANQRTAIIRDIVSRTSPNTPIPEGLDPSVLKLIQESRKNGKEFRDQSLRKLKYQKCRVFAY